MKRIQEVTQTVDSPISSSINVITYQIKNGYNQQGSYSDDC